MQKYDENLITAARELVRGVPHLIANLANVAALIYNETENINWAGFYLLKGETLVLGPFQGKPACIEIPISRGVCGAAAREDRVMSVNDVHSFPGHIACDPDSRSELVIPLHKDGKVFGVLDIDSPVKDRFTDEDSRAFSALAAVIEEIL
ncbi:MAG: GAF domain-containing protein [Clostridia bacterium]|nr:GAF domain-containing protein [Clostridia bacterium]